MPLRASRSYRRERRQSCRGQHPRLGHRHDPRRHRKAMDWLPIIHHFVGNRLTDLLSRYAVVPPCPEPVVLVFRSVISVLAVSRK